MTDKEKQELQAALTEIATLSRYLADRTDGEVSERLDHLSKAATAYHLIYEWDLDFLL